MKVLFDENVPIKAIINLGEEYEHKTVRDMGWLGEKNGELMRLMVSNEFDFFVTLDRSIQYQQNLSKFEVVIFLIVASDNKSETIYPLIQKVKVILNYKEYKKFNMVTA